MYQTADTQSTAEEVDCAYTEQAENSQRTYLVQPGMPDSIQAAGAARDDVVPVAPQAQTVPFQLHFQVSTFTNTVLFGGDLRPARTKQIIYESDILDSRRTVRAPTAGDAGRRYVSAKSGGTRNR